MHIKDNLRPFTVIRMVNGVETKLNVLAPNAAAAGRAADEAKRLHEERANQGQDA